MTTEDTLTNASRQQAACSVVILHDTRESLTRATALCEQIMVRFWEEMDIQLAHWAMETLSGSDAGEEAAAHAATADILVVATSGSGAFPREFTVWTENWLNRRKQREGMLVSLLNLEQDSESPTHLREVHLHRLALRAGMDFLNHLPQTPPHSIPDVTNWCSSRAATLTSTLDQIIRSNPKFPEN